MARKFLLFLVLLTAPSAAFADDASYCAQLSDMYRRYMQNYGNGTRFADVTAATAMDQCTRGNYAAGIATLEKKLRDARFTLPPRN